MTRLWIATEMNLRDLTRRRSVLGLLFTIPLVFYLTRRGDAPGQAVKFLFLGLGFTVSTASLFSTVSARALDARLVLSGYRVAELYLARWIALIAVGLAIMVPYVGVLFLDQNIERMGAVVVAICLSIVVAAPLGMTLGALVPRELEGALLLLSIVATQFLLDPARPVARCAPFWSAREIGTYAIDLADGGYLRRGIVHALCYATVAFLLSAAITAVRLRDRRPAGASLPHPVNRSRTPAATR